MASYDQLEGSNEQISAMLAGHQANGRNPTANASDASAQQDRQDRPHYTSFTQNNRHLQPSYGDEVSPVSTFEVADVFLPPAPTPPSYQSSHQLMGMGMMGMPNLGPIGSMPLTGDKKELLGIFHRGNSHAAHGSSQSSTSGPNQMSFDTSHIAPQTNVPPTLHAPVPHTAVGAHLASLMSGDAQPEPKPNNHDFLLSLLKAQGDNEGSQPVAPPSANEELQLKQSQGQKTTQDSAPFPYNNHMGSPTGQYEYNSPLSQTEPRATGRYDYKGYSEDLASSSPHNSQNMTTQSLTPGNAGSAAVAPGVQILKKVPSTTSSPGSLDSKRLSAQRSPMVSPDHVHQNKVTSAFTMRHPQFNESDARPMDDGKVAVSEAMEYLREKVDKEAQDSIDQAMADEAQSRIAKDLEAMMRAKDEAEFDETSKVAARDIQKELEKAENVDLLERTLSPEMAQAVRDIVDETANGSIVDESTSGNIVGEAASSNPVADNWESAEADEIVVIEEDSTPVKVYNFPMKPWISITLQDKSEEPRHRPLFRDEAILDIARVKKEFDQIDRNLVAATETYIVYGMSKAGGLRVIRQEDGSDAKLFTDTKDRIFNIAISSTAPELGAGHKESIIGTGVSGTVYYILIRNGNKDYLDDTHPEQYGFALPPITTQEGDAPGGVLKTRAKTSSTHPDYFAVGRGKMINIIWPSYIMQHQVFKPGHDRVVDTDKLSKKCSLRINTGKAGKDFTFSQDDTTIVSLDKSGRVKFWDIRDLTASIEDGDSRFPMPAYTSLEVKEPLMTLTTTPEGEKAWPTSVLLLDKQRPYQKRCALRYMIVGMKQNHTLQLWDLALGKPVQEFNLPHSKESDAVCSVMYNPPTGMIIVGHPTRNSVYFLHLSAPKYTIKGLSQVDYIQKLVAKDSSIPEPDSTAVISGVREYSFSNKGVIRSLDILAPAAAGTSNDEEPPLFELYAMHSKGVSGITIKQSELGWTRDNKVIAPVDAVESGVVKITKLKELPSSQPSEPHATEDTPSLPIRIAARSSLKENIPPSGQDEGNSKDIDDQTPRKSVQDRKPEAPVTPANQTEKTDKRRRTRNKAAAAMAAAAASEKHFTELGQTNGNSQFSHAGPASAKNGESKATSASMQPMISSDTVQSIVAKMESAVTKAIDTAIHDYGLKMDRELHSRDVAFEKNQNKLLDVVSDTLTDNVQVVLTNAIYEKVKESVVPALGELVPQTLAQQYNQFETKMSGRISHGVQNQMQKLVPAAVNGAINGAVNGALQKPELAKAVADKIVQTLSFNIEKSFSEALEKTITPTFATMATAVARDIVNDVRRDAAEQINVLEQKIRADSNKIDQLTALVTRLSDTVSAMASAQAQFQDSFLKMQQQASRDHQPQPQPQHTTTHSHYSQPSQSVSFSSQRTQAPVYNSPSAHSGNQMMQYAQGAAGNSRDIDLERNIAEIRMMFERREYEAGLVKWLQSNYKAEIFSEYLTKTDSRFLGELSPLVSLAIISEVSRNLHTGNLQDKVAWMEIIIHTIHGSLPHIDGQVCGVIPSILGNFVAETESLFVRISGIAPNDTILKHLSQMCQMAKRIIDAAKANLSGF